jgi:hypothetical protein
LLPKSLFIASAMPLNSVTASAWADVTFVVSPISVFRLKSSFLAKRIFHGPDAYEKSIAEFPASQDMDCIFRDSRIRNDRGQDVSSTLNPIFGSYSCLLLLPPQNPCVTPAEKKFYAVKDC